jgi:hypothetical protein
VDALAELVCAGFLTFYLLFLLALVAAPLLRSRRARTHDSAANRWARAGGTGPQHGGRHRPMKNMTKYDFKLLDEQGHVENNRINTRCLTRDHSE